MGTMRVRQLMWASRVMTRQCVLCFRHPGTHVGGSFIFIRAPSRLSEQMLCIARTGYTGAFRVVNSDGSLGDRFFRTIVYPFCGAEGR